MQTNIANKQKTLTTTTTKPKKIKTKEKMMQTEGLHEEPPERQVKLKNVVVLDMLWPVEL